MAVRLRQNNLKLSGVVTSAIVIGGSMLLFKTYPHIKALFKFSSQESKPNYEEDNTPVPAEDDIEIEGHHIHELNSASDAKNLNTDSIKAILVEVCINGMQI